MYIVRQRRSSQLLLLSLQQQQQPRLTVNIRYHNVPFNETYRCHHKYTPVLQLPVVQEVFLLRKRRNNDRRNLMIPVMLWRRSSNNQRRCMSHYDSNTTSDLSDTSNSSTTTKSSSSSLLYPNDDPQLQQPQLPLTNNIQILFFSQVSIEPTYSAAGVRSLYILQQFLLQQQPNTDDSKNDNNTNNTFKKPTTSTMNVTAVHVISPPNKNNDTASPKKQQQQINNNETNKEFHDHDPNFLGSKNQFHFHTLLPNRIEDAYQLLDHITISKNDYDTESIFYIIIYDRYYSEEMYSYIVYNYFHKQLQPHPQNHLGTHQRYYNTKYHQYISILDMQDMHSLRYIRQLYVKQQDSKLRLQNQKLKLKYKNDIVHVDEHLTDNNDDVYNDDKSSSTIDDVLRYTIPSDDIVPSMIHNNNDKLLRELASIYRCDITFVCSMYEYNLLTLYYHIPNNILCYAPLFGKNSSISGTGIGGSCIHTDDITTTIITRREATQPEQGKDEQQQHEQQESVLLNYEQRQDYVFVGGMKHEPNVDAIRQLKRLWPKIRQKFIQDANHANEDNAATTVIGENKNVPSNKNNKQLLPNLYIYGAQCSNQFHSEIHDPYIHGIYMKGYYPYSIRKVLYNKRVLLSPLRYGAGIKGKHIEAWKCNVPIVTTSIGSEGMLYQPNYNNNNNNCPNFLKRSNDDDDDDNLEEKSMIFGGYIVNTDEDFIDAAYTLYNKKDIWDTMVYENINHDFLYNTLCHDWDRIYQSIINVIHSKQLQHFYNSDNNDQQEQILIPTASISSSHIAIQQILLHQMNRSTEYFSKYIALKEENNKKR